MDLLTTEGDHKLPDLLVVDDTPANLHLLADMLKEHGYRVRPAPSGKLALQAVQKEKPDLILLDINMPEMNGYEVCEQLKADETLKDIPVLFISALDETTDKIKAFAAGGVDYVTKPFQFEEVVARVHTHLNLRRLQLELEGQNVLLQEKHDQLKKLEVLRDNLIHMVVHDMRSPLMEISGNLELLDEVAGKKLDQSDQDMLANARNSAHLLMEMINSLLDVSRLEQGQMPLQVTESDMALLIQQALTTLGSLVNRVTLLYQKQAQPVLVACDAPLITRVIANLVGNALKFSLEGAAVAISFEKQERKIRLCVTDKGHGIPNEFHQTIFEKFGQVDARQHNIMYSTGLGLTFCKLAVEAHGGEIGVESEVGHGSLFWFTLPRGQTLKS